MPNLAYTLNTFLLAGTVTSAMLLACFALLGNRYRSCAQYTTALLGLGFVAYGSTSLLVSLDLKIPRFFSMFTESFLPLFVLIAATSLFEDDWWPDRRVAALALINCILSLLHLLCRFEVLQLEYADPLAAAIKYFHLVLLVVTVYVTGRSYHEDMVLIRIRLRVAGLLIGGGLLFYFISTDFYRLEFRQLAEWGSLTANFALFFLLMLAHIFLYRWPVLLFTSPKHTEATDFAIVKQRKQETSPASMPTETEESDGRARLDSVTQTDTNSLQAHKASEASRYLKRLNDLMENEQVFRTEGLTINDLAQKSGIPEYKLRKVIHSSLGFRNFNQYLAYYRVGFARQLLADPKFRHEKVLAIALETGYGSLAPFNRAFKAQTGTTPTTYKQNLKQNS